MEASPLRHHRERLHDIVLPQIRGGRCWGRRDGDLQGVIPADFEVCGVPDRGLPGKGKH